MQALKHKKNNTLVNSKSIYIHILLQDDKSSETFNSSLNGLIFLMKYIKYFLWPT